MQQILHVKVYSAAISNKLGTSERDLGNKVLSIRYINKDIILFTLLLAKMHFLFFIYNDEAYLHWAVFLKRTVK